MDCGSDSKLVTSASFEGGSLVENRRKNSSLGLEQIIWMFQMGPVCLEHQRVVLVVRSSFWEKLEPSGSSV